MIWAKGNIPSVHACEFRLLLWSGKATSCTSNAMSMNAYMTMDIVIHCAQPGASGMHAGAAPCMRPSVRTLLENTETPAHVVVIWNESFVPSCYGCVLLCVQPVSLNCPRPVRFTTISDDLLNLCDSREQPDPYTYQLQSASTSQYTLHAICPFSRQAQHDCVNNVARVSLLRAGPPVQSSRATSSSRSWNRLHLTGNTCCT